MAAEPAIRVENVAKRFLLQQDRASSIKELFTTRRDRNPDRGFWAVRDVTLDVPAGTTFGLIGHNGSGK
ncbi:MAG: ABC transporter ATP-binding protein, partial [Actinomycetia bacterium]|nr:ABC transporter ATP-binding protein [Actinomycetes bacterium]